MREETKKLKEKIDKIDKKFIKISENITEDKYIGYYGKKNYEIYQKDRIKKHIITFEILNEINKKYLEIFLNEDVRPNDKMVNFLSELELLSYEFIKFSKDEEIKKYNDSKLPPSKNSNYERQMNSILSGSIYNTWDYQRNKKLKDVYINFNINIFYDYDQGLSNVYIPIPISNITVEEVENTMIKKII